MDTVSTRVLLIEDNVGDVRLIREMLREGTHSNQRSSGVKFEVEVAGTLQEGLLALEQRSFHIVLLDLSLPDSFGVETLRAITAEDHRTPIVVLTGLDDERFGLEAVQFGAQDYLVKGDIDGKLLTRAIRYAIERYMIESALRAREEEYRSLIDDVFNTSAVAVLIFDKDFTVVWINDATEIYFGVNRGEILGEDVRILVEAKLKCIFENPDEYAHYLLRSYEQNIYAERYECHILPEGTREQRWLEHWSQPIRSGMYAGGRIEQYTDITRRKLIETAEQEQRQMAEALREITVLLTSTLDLDEVLDLILTNVEHVVPHHMANITLIVDDQLEEFWHWNSPEEAESNIRQMLKPRTISDTIGLHDMITTHRPVIVGNISSLQLAKLPPGLRDARAYIGVPIILQNQVIGAIKLFSRTAGFFMQFDVERLSAFAEHAAIAIQNAQLYRESQELAAYQERQRLARDLHDSVSQTLFSSSVMAESALRQWDANPTKAYDLLGNLHSLTKSALAEMRVLLLELRPTALTQISFYQLVEQYVESIRNRKHYTVTLTTDRVPRLPPDAQIALYRILQEALNNIIKHAEASQVMIRIVQQDGWLRMTIEDNGRGFDQAAVGASSMGLGFMRERAEGIGAHLALESSIGAGTRIMVEWEHHLKFVGENNDIRTEN